MNCSPFDILCGVASRVLEQASIVSEEESNVKADYLEWKRQMNYRREERTRALKSRENDLPCEQARSKPVGVRNAKPMSRKWVKKYVYNLSNKHRKKFRLKCKYAPNLCSKIIVSYGNEENAILRMKRHLFDAHFLWNLIPKSSDCEDQINEDGSNLRQLTEKADEEENVLRPLDTDFEANGCTDCNGTLSTIKIGDFAHTYVKRIPLFHEIGQRKNRRKSIDIPVNKFDLNRHLCADGLIGQPVISTPPFPLVYTPDPLEAACIVELDSNGAPVDMKESVFVQASTNRISAKKVMENKMRRKSKFVPLHDSLRSVLECVENRVACNSNVSSEQKDALSPDDSIENSENVEKSMHEIAWKHIQILSEQRKKRKYRDKPTAYICEICNKQFTANTSLTYHYMGHAKMKPFQCDICCRTFTRRHSLKYHLMIHADENRFQCETCKRRFRHPSHYKEHLRKHTGEEPFSCKFCPNKFKTSNSFKRHLKMQHQKLLTSVGIVPIHNDS